MRDLDGYDADPELWDESDPAYKEEMFRMYRHLWLKPEALTTNPVYAAEYAAWLK